MSMIPPIYRAPYAGGATAFTAALDPHKRKIQFEFDGFNTNDAVVRLKGPGGVWQTIEAPTTAVNLTAPLEGAFTEIEVSGLTGGGDYYITVYNW